MRDPEPYTFKMPDILTQSIINRDADMKRFQQDLLVLSSLNDNETLFWRPPWFKQSPFSDRLWTLHNPPNVVTERVPSVKEGRQYFTRRIRLEGDAPPAFIKTWKHWKHYCELYGVPEDLFCQDHIVLLRLGLPRTPKASFCRRFSLLYYIFVALLKIIAPPAHPLYPEPPSVGEGTYILDPSCYITHLPKKFHCVDHTASSADTVEIVVVDPDGKLSVMSKDQFLMQKMKQLQLDHPHGSTANFSKVAQYMMLRPQGPGKRWSYVPWTRKQEESCQPQKLSLKRRKLTLNLRFMNQTEGEETKGEARLQSALGSSKV